MLGSHRKDILLGNIQPALFGFPKFYLDPKDQEHHATIWGSTGSGKSFLLLSIFVQKLLMGQGVGLIDPHNDLSVDIIRQLIHQGFFKNQSAYKKLVYIDWGNRLITPFNILDGAVDDQFDPTLLDMMPTSATNKVLEMAKRVWPELEHSAPTFKEYFRSAMKVLIANRLPLGLIQEFLTDKTFRQACLHRVTEQQDLRKWEFIDDPKTKPAEVISEIGSSRRRADDLLYDPVARYAFASPDNVIRHREWMDNKVCFIHNLGKLSPETRQIIGALLLVDIEQSLKSRMDLAYNDRPPMTILVDEWQLFADQEKTISNTLSETRKYGGRLYLATQHLAVVTSSRLQGALGQCKLNIVMNIDPDSAEKQADYIADYDMDKIKEEAMTNTQHNMFAGYMEQKQDWITDLKTMKPRLAYVKLRTKPAVQIQTVEVPVPKVSQEQLDEVVTTYRQLYQQTVPQAHARMSSVSMPNKKDPVYSSLYKKEDE